MIGSSEPKTERAPDPLDEPGATAQSTRPLRVARRTGAQIGRDRDRGGWPPRTWSSIRMDEIANGDRRLDKAALII
jgi:hypothetical protein